ncbi:MAG: two-component regulator propeller domain-containing protein, partial [Bacteroidota bacterium]
MISGTALLAQPARYYFEHLNTEDGLSQNDVNCILQDRRGFMWFGTNDGLNRYDGYDFLLYKPNENVAGTIISNLIQELEEDHLGRIWIGTAGAGISCFNPMNQQFVNFKDLRDPNFRLRSDFILNIFEDSKQRLWVTTAKGIHLFQTNGDLAVDVNSVQNITDQAIPDQFKSRRVEGIYEDQQGTIWVGCQPGLYKLSEPAHPDSTFKFSAVIPRIPVRSIIQGPEGSMLVGSPNGLFIVSSQVKGKYQPQRIQYGPHERMLFLGKNLWTTSDLGLSQFSWDANTDKFVFENLYTSDLGDFHSLNKTVLRTIYGDREGIIWIGTNGGGINKFEPEQKTFFHYKKTLEPGSISYDKIRSIYEDSEENLWVGTEGGGLNFLPKEDADQGNFDRFSHLAKPSYVFSQVEYQQGNQRYMLLGGQT